ncbi:MAG: hypothetical protein QOG04_1122 [Actinomycetota bacterium]|jgi:hypothetical protein|nr:hypothetical protein [Actinomycetota bacterium]
MFRMKIALVVVAAAALLTACSASTLKAEDLNKEISAQLQDRFDVEAVVECPNDIEPKEGGTFECTASDTEGNSLPVQVVQNDDQGNIDWSLDVFNLPVVEETLAPEVSQSVDAVITINCPRILVSSLEGSTMDCDVTDDLGRDGLLRITSLDDQGNVDWELNP